MDDKKQANRIIDSVPICITSVIFVLLTASVKTLAVNGNIVWNFAFVAKLLILSFVFGILLGFGINEIVRFFTAHVTIPDSKVEYKKAVGMFFISLSVLILAYLPYFLAYYPGILAYDSYIQIDQIFTGAYNEHHPLIHTLLIKFTILAGEKIFGYPNAGIAVCVAVQSLLLIFVFSYGIFLLYKRGKRLISIIVLIILALFPFNAFMAVSVTKDIPFSAYYLLLVLSSSELLRKEKIGLNKIFDIIILAISSLGCVVYRNNGRYAMAFAIVICLFLVIISAALKSKDKENRILRKNYLITLGVTFASMLVAFVLLTVASKSLNAVQGDKREMLSVPIQQFARTYVYHSGSGIVPGDDNTLDDTSKDLINDFILYDGALLYRSDISDPVKRCTNTWVVTNRTKDFIKTYLKLFVRYPGDYINAFLATNAGFIDFTDETHAHINEIEGINGLGYVQTRWNESLFEKGFTQDPKLTGLFNLFEKFANTNAYLKIPFLKYIFMPGIYLWIYIFAMVYAFKKKNMRFAFAVSLTAGYYLTMLFGPCVQLRYVYPVMISVPFTVLFNKEKTE